MRHALHAAIGVALSLLCVPGAIARVAGGAMADPDSYMRLVRVRDGLAHGGFATRVAADSGGAGTDTCWSHLLDTAILALRWPLAQAMDGEAALRWAGAAMGPLSLGALATAAAWAAAPLGGGWASMAAVAASLAPVALAYGALGCAHHHVALAAVAVLLAGWTGRAVAGRADAAAAAGVWAGFWAGIGVWLSPELTPIVLLAFGALLLAWLRRPSRLPQRAAAAFAAVVVVAWWLDPPLGGHAVAQVDRLSLVYVLLALLLLAVSAWLGLVAASPPRLRRALGIAGVVLAAAAWVAMFPALLRGPTGMLPPDQAHAFFDVIAEMQPAWRCWPGALSAGIAPAFAMLVALGRARRGDAALWGYAALCVAALAALGMRHWRFAIYGQAAGAVLLPAALASLSAWAGASARGAALRVATLALTLGAPMWLLHAAPAASAAPPQAGARRCEVRDILPALARFGDAVVVGDISDAPELLYRTRLRTLGSLYHHAIGAFLRARDIWRSPAAVAAPAPVRAAGVGLILACNTGEPDPLVDGAGHRTLADQLAAGEVPPWLVAVPDGAAGGYRLFRVSD